MAGAVGMGSDMTSSPNGLWKLERRAAMATLRFVHPPRNFLTFQAFAELEELLGELADDEAVRTVVLASGVDGYFAAHADLDELALLQQGPVPEARYWYTAMRAVERLPQPVVALLSGQVWGGGLELALACDIRVALPDAHFRLPETALGIIPGAGGTQRLMRLIGPGLAANLVLSGRRLGAEEAASVGLVERILSAAEADAYLDSITTKPRAALVAAKQALREGKESDLRQGLKVEGRLFADLLTQSASRELVACARAAYAAAADEQPVDVVASVGHLRG
ncbi:MAG: enoyl-CoA hydratase/isomerase family protein [Frankiales bacterium]|nr:MAG: enoyl-CoA hydratase/isomerase family protein [Frankiales bacterium]